MTFFSILFIFQNETFQWAGSGAPLIYGYWNNQLYGYNHQSIPLYTSTHLYHSTSTSDEIFTDLHFTLLHASKQLHPHRKDGCTAMWLQLEDPVWFHVDCDMPVLRDWVCKSYIPTGDNLTYMLKMSRQLVYVQHIMLWHYVYFIVYFWEVQ